MKHDSDTIIQKCISISGKIFLSIVAMFFLAGIISGVITILDVNWKWLESIGKGLFGASFLLLAISWLAPGIFIVVGHPGLAHAWLKGINSFSISIEPWEQLSFGKKIFVYFYALLISILTLLAVIGVVQYAR